MNTDELRWCIPKDFKAAALKSIPRRWMDESGPGLKGTTSGACRTSWSPGLAWGAPPLKILFFSSVFICVHLWLSPSVFAGPTPVPADTLAKAAEKLDEAKEELQKLKDVWDRARLEATLYDQRARRAYKSWAKSAKKAREQARLKKEKAQLEFLLAIEKRKWAFSQWQAAQYRMLADESQVKALAQDKDTQGIQAKIKELEIKLRPLPIKK